VIDQVDIRVRDLEASRRFYAPLLAELGRPAPLETSADHVDWGDFTIVADGAPAARHLHVAFAAPSPELVRAPVRDPDGNTVEVVHSGPPWRPGAIDHVRLRSRDVAAMERFHATIGLDDGGAVRIEAGEPPTEHVHIAFGVATNAAVDAFHRTAVGAGYRDNGAPGERPAYHPGYYGAFVLDPDGHNVEAVNHNLADG